MGHKSGELAVEQLVAAQHDTHTDAHVSAPRRFAQLLHAVLHDGRWAEDYLHRKAKGASDQWFSTGLR